MIRRAAFVIGSILSALLAMEVSPPPSYIVARFSPAPSPRPQLRPLVHFRWPGTFHRKLSPGATFSARPT